MAAVGEGGATHAQIVARSGLSPTRVDAGLRGALNGHLLAQLGGRYYGWGHVPKIPDNLPVDGGRRLRADAPKPPPPKLTPEERAQRATARRKTLSDALTWRSEGHTYATIGRRLGVTAGTSYRLVQRAQALRAEGRV